MKDVLRSRVTWTASLLILGYFVLMRYVPVSNTKMYEGLHTLRISIGIAVIIAYSDVCLDAIRVSKPDRVGQLALGIVTSWIGTVGSGLWSLLWRLGGKPPWMLESSFSGVWWWLMILGGILHITAPGAINGIVPRRNKIRLGVGVGAGVLATLILIAVQPDLTHLVELIEPYFRE